MGGDTKDIVSIGEKINTAKVLSNAEDFHKLVSRAKLLSPEAIKRIGDNNKAIAEWLKAHPHPKEVLTGAKADEIIRERLHPELAARSSSLDVHPENGPASADTSTLPFESELDRHPASGLPFEDEISTGSHSLPYEHEVGSPAPGAGPAPDHGLPYESEVTPDHAALPEKVVGLEELRTVKIAFSHAAHDAALQFQ
jgi:hypothetical protein